MVIADDSRFSVYCDESCHLEHDGHPIMVMGAVWCPKTESGRISQEIMGLKERFRAHGELKWSKVGPSKVEFYDALIEWFFKENSLNFRGLVVLNKDKLDHEAFNQGSHDLFYYKMYFSLLREILSPERMFDIYLDIKDTRSRKKVHKLREILCYDQLDFTSSMITNLQNIRSHESNLMQLTDFFCGILSFKHRYITTEEMLGRSKTKFHLVNKFERLGLVDLSHSTSKRAEKINVFCFRPRHKIAHATMSSTTAIR